MRYFPTTNDGKIFLFSSAIGLLENWDLQGGEAWDYETLEMRWIGITTTWQRRLQVSVRAKNFACCLEAEIIGCGNYMAAGDWSKTGCYSSLTKAYHETWCKLGRTRVQAGIFLKAEADPWEGGSLRGTVGDLDYQRNNVHGIRYSTVRQTRFFWGSRPHKSLRKIGMPLATAWGQNLDREYDKNLGTQISLCPHTTKTSVNKILTEISKSLLICQVSWAGVSDEKQTFNWRKEINGWIWKYFDKVSLIWGASHIQTTGVTVVGKGRRSAMLECI